MKPNEQVIKELHVEVGELNEKREKLTNFIHTPHSGLSQRQKDLLLIQLAAMKSYAFTLLARIDDLTSEAE